MGCNVSRYVSVGVCCMEVCNAMGVCGVIGVEVV